MTFLFRLCGKLARHLLGSLLDFTVALLWISLTIWGNVWATSEATSSATAIVGVNLASLAGIALVVFIVSKARGEMAGDGNASDSQESRDPDLGE